jgi:pyruvate dehydrogenase E2 component (dihydrolipoamide acetyltransferase)
MTIFQMKNGVVEPVAIIKAGKTTKVGPEAPAAAAAPAAPAAAPAMAPAAAPAMAPAAPAKEEKKK